MSLLSRLYELRLVFLLAFVALFSQINWAQNSVQPTNQSITKQTPKIGLVLSGGGAKGLAHIGVLKVIDSLNIKIDYIAGTSMGAIVGGLYAAGYSGKQLDSIFKNLNTEALVQDYTPRKSKSFRTKKNDEIYAFTLPFNKFKIELPTSLSRGMYNFNLFSKLLLPISDTTDFKDLSIPFFCIATNIETGEEVILDKGNLAQALVASGAIPSLYNPKEINGVLLLDGGLVNNYPVKRLKEKGINYIIGIDVQASLKKAKELKGASDILNQISSFSIIKNFQEKKETTNCYIKPNIDNYNVLSFDKGKEIIKEGEKAALANIKTLQKLEKKVKNNHYLHPIDSIVISEIHIKGLKNFTRAYVKGKLKIKENQKITIQCFIDGINRLNATQNFESISYNFETNGNNPETKNVTISLSENTTTSFIKFSAHYNNLLKTSFLTNFTKKRLFTKNDIASLDVILGDHFRYNFNYYIDNGFYWSFGVSSRLISFNKNIQRNLNNGISLTDLNVASVNVSYSDWSNSIFFETIFAQTFSSGLGLEHKYLDIDSNNLNVPYEDDDYYSFYGYLKFDSFNDKYFPKRGWYFNGKINYFFDTSNQSFQDKTTILKADMGIAKSFFNDKLTVIVENEGGLHAKEGFVSNLNFALGGYGFTAFNNFRSFYGYDFVSLLGDSYVKGTITLNYEFIKNNNFNIAGNFSNIGNKLFENTNRWLTKPQYTGYAIGYGLKTILGPAEIKHSWSPETRTHYTWFSVGFWF